MNGSRRKNGSVGGGGGGCGGGTGKTCFPQLDKTLHQVGPLFCQAINFSGKYKHKKNSICIQIQAKHVVSLFSKGSQAGAKWSKTKTDLEMSAPESALVCSYSYLVNNIR